MIDNHEACVQYEERLFSRDAHTFRLISCNDVSCGKTWESSMVIKTAFEAHLHAMTLMNGIAYPYQVWIMDETAGDTIRPLADILDRYETIRQRKEEASQ